MDKTATGKVRHTITRLGGCPARPGQEEHAHRHAQDLGLASSDPEGEVFLRPERGGVGVHTKLPRCTGQVPCQTTDGTGNRTRQ